MMSIQQLIVPGIPAVSPTTKGSDLLRIMEDTHYTSIPVVVEGKYIGLVTEENLLAMHNIDASIQSIEHVFIHAAMQEFNHPFEVIKLASAQKLSVVPLVDAENNYLGAISTERIVDYVCETSGIDNPGGIIVLEVEPRNYSLAEIARICESESVVILTTMVASNSETNMLQITIKTNKASLEAVTSAFERYQYSIVATFGATTAQDLLSDRYKLLMNYINM